MYFFVIKTNNPEQKMLTERIMSAFWNVKEREGREGRKRR